MSNCAVKYFIARIKYSYKILHNINSKTTYLIYLLECILCKYHQVGNARKHCNCNGDNFQHYAKLESIEQLNDLDEDKETLRKYLKIRANFRISKLETLHSKQLQRNLQHTLV